MKYLLVLLTALTITVSEAAAQKFGHIDSQVLLDTLPETATAQAELEQMNKEYEEVLKQQQLDLEKLVAEIQAMEGDPSVSDFVKQSKYSQYESDQQRLQQALQTAEQSLAQKQQELLSPIIEKARNAIKEVGKESGFTYIFDLSSGGIIYEGGEDVMPLVLTKLGM